MKASNTDLPPSRSSPEIMKSVFVLMYAWFALIIPFVLVIPPASISTCVFLSAFAVMLVIGFMVAYSRRRFARHFSFGKVYDSTLAMRRLGKILIAVGIMGFLGLFLGVSQGFLGRSNAVTFLFWPLTIGILLICYADLFPVETLSRLCLRTAMESRTSFQKLVWISRALKHVKESCSFTGLEFGVPALIRLFALHLSKGQNMNEILRETERSISKGGLPFASLNKVTLARDYGFITVIAPARERFMTYLESLSILAKYLGPIIVLLLSLWLRVPWG